MKPTNHSRRNFLKGVATGSALTVAAATLTGCHNDDSPATPVEFNHGIASGDPLADRVMIWTRITPETDGELSVNWEVASDESFGSIVNSGTAKTSLSQDYTIKVDADGLEAGTVYFYRFNANGTTSAVGTTKTLPSGETNQAKLAVVSCSNYPAGYFHAYAEIAKRDDLDAVLHLGDYIYEYEKDGYASAEAEAMGRTSIPATELISLEDYRQRYAQYHSDTDLQAAHAKLPFIVVWDDHELANDAYATGAENHDPATEGDFLERRANALKAFHEWIPIRDQGDSAQPQKIYRSFEFGNLLSLYMLDTRIIARDKQLDYLDYMDPATGAFDAATFQAELTSPTRQLLGQEQTDWLTQSMAQSTATWQVLGQQVLMGRMDLPAPVATQAISFTDYSRLLQKAATTPAELTEQETAILQQPSIPYNLDAWDGYFVARETVLGAARATDKNLVVLSGDTHNAWANDLLDIEGNQVGVEFATSSISSPGLEDYLTDEDPAALAAGLTQLIEPLRYADTSLRGYMTITLSTEETQAEWHFVTTVKSENYQIATDHSKSLRVLPSAGNRRIV